MDYSTIFENDRNAFELPKWDELPDIELYMDQVITLMNKYFGVLSSGEEPLLTSSMINNYVKNGIIPPPIKKRYSRTHLFRLIVICIMKSVLPINDIALLMDTMLKSQSEQEVLDYFAESYSREFHKTLDLIHTDLTQHAESPEHTDTQTLVSFSVMHAAAISGGSKFFAKNALTLLKQNNLPEQDEAKQPKKTKNKSADAKE
ncbi:MAG: DUF1836 domain-containing protein [Oscillospiraceae bacterium]